MSTTGTTKYETPARRAKWRSPWFRSVCLVAVAVLTGVIGLYVHLVYTAERELREAVAEADRLDPGWRLEDIEAARAAVPDEENGALVVLAARALMPAKWMAPPANGAPCLADRLTELAPRDRPNDADLAELRAELAKVAPALVKARRLADLPRGRFKVTYSDDLIGTLVPHAFEPRLVSQMLAYDALVRSADGDVEGALRSCQAMLNAGRSLGDEPLAISQLNRSFCAIATVRALERTLATGTVKARALDAMQQALAAEAEVPRLLIAARAERLAYYQALEAMRTGRFSSASYKIMPTFLGSKADDLIAGREAAACEAAYLRYTNALVEIAKLPTQDQEQQFKDLAKPVEPLPKFLAALTTGGPTWVNTARSAHHTQAELRSAAAALAAERYRLAEGHWPNRLADLVPRYLDAVPIDPFDGQPLRLAHLPDRLVIYSIGPDRIDDGGKIDRDNPQGDVGFQLWELR